MRDRKRLIPHGTVLAGTIMAAVESLLLQATALGWEGHRNIT